MKSLQFFDDLITMEFWLLANLDNLKYQSYGQTRGVGTEGVGSGRVGRIIYNFFYSYYVVKNVRTELKNQENQLEVSLCKYFCLWK